jgi:transcriptional regulator GlxA family with amidase domain
VKRWDPYDHRCLVRDVAGRAGAGYDRPGRNLLLAGEAFRLHYIGPDAEVPTSIGLTMGNIAPLPDSLPEGSLLVLPGVHQSAHYFATPQADTVRHWLMRMQPLIHSQKVLLMCVCSGSLLAAKAGLMTGIQCTTHHDVIARLRAAAPAALVKENRIFIEDRGSGPVRGSPPVLT